MKRSTLALGAIAAIIAGPALAGGTVTTAPAPAVVPITPAPAPMMDWSGFYLGGELGYADVEVEGPTTGEGDGAIYGIFGGYRYDFGDFVVGAELDLNMADIDLGAAGSLESVHRLGIEAGYDAGPALIYATAGFAQATVDDGSDSITDDGYFYGVGVDYALTDRVTIGAEVLHHDFQDFDDTTDLGVGAMTFGVNAALRF